MKDLLFSIVGASVLLTACGTMNTTTASKAEPAKTVAPAAQVQAPAQASAPATQQNITMTRYVCNGNLVVQVGNQLINDKLPMVIQGQQGLLDRAVSGSGERYVGGGVEWHRGGNDAILTVTNPQGQKVDLNCKAG
ncbi:MULTISPECIES: MliC family protein [unclassified Acinetobacter]|uniref:MliC family protein n=1 Tax=unclassified Acinetobacter TaxID=196816 RepID=UPI0035B9F786